MSYRLDSGYYVFVFASTLLLYSVHRIYGLRRVSSEESARYQTIESLNKVLVIIASIAGLVASICFFRFDNELKLYLIVPSLISVGYAIPIWKGKRLRDLHFIKIFLIAICWAWVVCTLPGIRMDKEIVQLGILSLALICYMLAITIPFDIRDLQVDKTSNVKTLPYIFGFDGSGKIATILLIIAAGSFIYLGSIQHGIFQYWMVSVFYIVLGIIIYLKRKPQLDYYYTGFLDGTMIILGGLAMLY